MPTMDTEKKNYEIGFLLKSEEDGPVVKKVLGGRKAEITEEGPIIGIKLSYPIKKENMAYFGYVRFLAEPEKLEEIETEIRQNPAILRHLTVIYPIEKINKAKKERRSFEMREASRKKAASSRVSEAPVVKKTRKIDPLTNEDLEKKLEEILE